MSKEQSEITLQDIHNDILELIKWTKFSGIKEIKPILETQLATDSKKLIYHLSDGTKGTQEIAKIVGDVSHMSVANYWKTWEKLGLGASVSAMGGKRFKRSFDLDDFGIKVKPTTVDSKQSKEEEKDE